jgi:GT2 family glycosyltransferase
MFSVSMVCYGRPDDLRKALTALVKYQPPGLEVLLIDNNSPQSVYEVYQEFSDYLTVSLVLRHQLPSSLAFASARNLALSLARNSWIMSLDPDCVIGPNYFEGVCRAIDDFADKEGRLMLAGERRFIRSQDVTVPKILTDPASLTVVPQVRSVSNHFLLRDKRMLEMKDLPDIEHPWDYMHGCNVVYSAEIARKCGGHDEIFDGSFGYEDIDFAYRMMTDLKCSSRYVTDMLVFHLEPDSNTWQPDRSERKENSNWLEIGRHIPGYHEFKLRQYSRLGIRLRGLKSGPRA